MSRDDGLILDIVLAARDARQFIRDLSFADFEASRLHQYAAIRSLEIIGEAANKLSDRFKQSTPNLSWRAIIGMRNRLIHVYNDVSLDIVWACIKDDLPQLIATLEKLIPPDNESDR